MKNLITRLLMQDKFSAIIFTIYACLGFLLIIKGYPLPCCDDLAVVGAALNIANSGDFSNPYVREWMDAFPATKPFFYPPGISYLLGSWLSIFGISVESVLSFQWVAILALCYSTFYFLGSICRQTSSVALVGSLAFLLAFQFDGMRGEVVSYAFGMVGTCLALMNRIILRTTGYFILAFSGVIYPVAPFIFMPIFLAGYLSSDDGIGFSTGALWRYFLRELPLAFIGGIISLILFLLMIDGEWEDFFRVMNIHRNAAIPGGVIDQLKGYWFISTAYNQVYIRLPLMILSCCAVCYSMISSVKHNDRDWIAPTLLLLACLISVITNPMRAKNLVPVIQTIIVLVTIARMTNLHKWSSPVTGLFFISIINLKLFLTLFLQEPMDSDSLEKARLTASQIDYKNTRVFTCSWSARYVYSYKVPTNIVDISTWTIVPKLHHNRPVRQLYPSRINDHEIWLLSEEFYFILPPSEKSYIKKPHSASFLGVAIPNVMARQSGICLIDQRQPKHSHSTSDS